MKLWIFAPRDEVNQKWIGGCQSMVAALSTLNEVRLLCYLPASSMRTTSAGLTDELQRPTITGAFSANCTSE